MAQPDLVQIVGGVTSTNRLADTYRAFIDKGITNIIPFANYAITLCMDEMGSDSTPTHSFKWPVQPYNTLEFTPIDVFTDLFATAYTTGGVTTGQYFIQVTAANAKHAQRGDILELTDTQDYTRIKVQVLRREIATDTTSYYLVQPLEADTDNVMAASSTYLRAVVHSRSDSEVSQAPEGQYEEASLYENTMQHMLAAADISDLAAADQEAYGTDIKMRIRMQALDKMMRKREGWRLDGIMSESKMQARGIRNFIPSANKINWLTDTTYSASGDTWNQGALPFFRRIQEVQSRFASGGDLSFITSSYVINQIEEAILDSGEYRIVPEMVAYGTLKVKTLTGLNRNMRLIEHPRFSTTDSYRHSALLTDFALLKNVKHSGLPDKFIDWTPPSERKAETYQSSQKCVWDIYESMKLINVDAHYWFEGLGLDK